MTRTVVVVVLLILLAGCTGLVDDGATATPASDSPTATPGGESSTETPEPTPDDGYPPGVSEAGLENVTALVGAHDDAVTETGFRSELVMTVGYADDSIPPVTLTHEAAVSADGYPYLYSATNEGGLSLNSVEVTWANESVEVTNRTTDSGFGDSETHYEMADPEPMEFDGTVRGLQEFVVFGEFDLVEETDDRLILRATTVAEAGLDENVTSYEGELVVDRQGRIREATLDFVLADEDGDLAMTVEYELDVGDVEIEKPDWVETAIYEASAHTIEASVEGDYVAVTNTGREPIPSGFTISLMEGSDDSNWSGSFAEVDEPIDPGETVYVSYDGREVVADRSPPDDPDPLSGTYRITVRDEDFNRVARVTVEADDE